MSFPYSSFRRHWPVIFTAIVLLLTLCIRWLAGAEWVENYFSRGIFPKFRFFWGVFTSWSPVPLFMVFWIFVLHRSNVFSSAAMRKGLSLKPKLLLLSRHLFLFWSWIIIAFFWMWGYNYSRQPVTETLHLSATTNRASTIGFTTYSMTLEELRERVYTEAKLLAELRKEITPDTNYLTRDYFPEDLVAAVQPLLVTALEKHGYPAPASVRLRQLWPPGILLRWSTSGVYWPWAGEGNIDQGLWHLSKPSVIAHELTHAYGFGDEGTCSFFAYLAGLEASSSPALRYAFRLDYWRRIASRLRRADPASYTTFRDEQLAPGIINDLNAIYLNNEKYPDFLPAVRNATYNTYLKAQGIEEGMLNYGTVVRLVEGYLLRK